MVYSRTVAHQVVLASERVSPSEIIGLRRIAGGSSERCLLRSRRLTNRLVGGHFRTLAQASVAYVGVAVSTGL